MITCSVIMGVEYYLPEQLLSTADLAILFPGRAASIDKKTGISTRHVAGENECASDLAFKAAMQLFSSGQCKAAEIDFIILCTQSGDFVLPATACILQDRLGIPRSAGAIDINQGCSGYVYCLAVAEGLIMSGQAKSILLLTADTLTKYLHPEDRGTRTIFGDGAAATWIIAKNQQRQTIGPFIFGTDGRGAMSLVLPNSGTRKQVGEPTDVTASASYLLMDGSAVFQFASSTIPQVVISLVERANIDLSDVDLFVFHQANAYLIEDIRRQLGVPSAKVQVTLQDCGNTSSSSIPIALKHADVDGKLKDGGVVMLVGFGVGLSWAATIVRWVRPYAGGEMQD